jgi:transketolase
MGVTHHATEDLGIMRMLPGLVVVAPGDPAETRLATRAIVEYSGPCYLRLGKAGEPEVHKGSVDFQLGKAIQLRNGGDLTLICTGGLLRTAARVAERLSESGIEIRVLSMHTLKPLDEQAVLSAACETKAIVTLEEHSLIGGLGSAVAEVLAEAEADQIAFKRIGLPPSFSSHIGSQEYLQAQHGLTEECVLKSLEVMIESMSEKAG